MAMFKITDEQAAKLGISSFEDLEKALSRGAKAEGIVDGFEAKITELAKTVSKLESRIGENKIDVDAIVSQAVAKANIEAETIAAKAVSSAIARAGQSGLAPNKPQSEGNETKPQPAADDYKGQWDASESIRAEFISFKSYEAFKRAEANGQIKQREARK